MNRYFIFIALFIILYILAVMHFVVFEGIILGFLIKNSTVVLGVKIFFSVMTLSFVLASVLTRNFNNLFTRWLYRVSAVWLGFLFYFFLASVIYILYLAAFPVSIYFAGILFVIAFLISIYGLVHANSIKIKGVNITLQNLPENWIGRKAMFVSDVHLGQVRGRNFAVKVCKEIGKINPDIVFIGGDMFDGVKVDEEKIVEPFSQTHPPLGIYFVSGNHEEFEDNSKYLSALGNAGIKVLENEAVDVEGVQIIGADYQTTDSREKFENVLNKIQIDYSIPSILLKHVPMHIDVAEKKGISLQLSGHTHKAQVFPFSLLTPFIFKGFDYGLKNSGNLQVYTSSGAGTWGPPLRVGTDSEIVSIIFN